VEGRGAEERRRKKAGSASDRGRVVEGGSVAVSRPWSRPSRRPRSWRGPRRQRWPERPRRASPWLSPAHPRQLPARAGSKRRQPRADRPGAKKYKSAKAGRRHLGRPARERTLGASSETLSVAGGVVGCLPSLPWPLKRPVMRVLSRRPAFGATGFSSAFSAALREGKRKTSHRERRRRGVRSGRVGVRTYTTAVAASVVSVAATAGVVVSASLTAAGVESTIASGPRTTGVAATGSPI